MAEISNHLAAIGISNPG